MQEAAIIPLPTSVAPERERLRGGGQEAADARAPVWLDHRLRVIRDAAFEALLVVDDDRRYLRVNVAATRVLGAPAEEILGRRLEHFTPSERWPLLERLWSQFQQRGKLEGAYEVLRGNGSRQPIVFRAHWQLAPGEHLIAAIEVPFRPPQPTHEARLVTERERQILGLVADGLSNAEIAHRLTLSPATVKTHLQNIYTKLGISDRTGAAVKALRAGLIS